MGPSAEDGRGPQPPAWARPVLPGHPGTRPRRAPVPAAGGRRARRHAADADAAAAAGVRGCGAVRARRRPAGTGLGPRRGLRHVARCRAGGGRAVPRAGEGERGTRQRCGERRGALLARDAARRPQGGRAGPAAAAAQARCVACGGCNAARVAVRVARPLQQGGGGCACADSARQHREAVVLPQPPTHLVLALPFTRDPSVTIATIISLTQFVPSLKISASTLWQACLPWKEMCIALFATVCIPERGKNES